MASGYYSGNKILELLVGKTAFTTPTCYVGLSTANPTAEASGLAEPSGGSYVRVETAGTDWEAASSGAIQNAEVITFAEATGDWGTVTYFSLFDASTAGNMLAYGALDTPQSIVSGKTARFAAGALDGTCS